MSHAEDREISPWDYRLAENIETVRNCHLAEYYGTRLHMCHVSTRESVGAVLDGVDQRGHVVRLADGRVDAVGQAAVVKPQVMGLSLIHI